MIAELAGRALGQRRMRHVLEHRLALFIEIGVGLALGQEIDRGAVQGSADGAGEEGAVVAAVVPGEPAFVMRFLPEIGHELHGVDGLLPTHSSLAAAGNLPI